MLTASRGFKAALLAGTSFVNIFGGGAIDVYSGSRPLTSEAPPSSGCVLLGTITPLGIDSGLQFTQDGPIIGSPLGAQWRLNVVASGTALWFRLRTATDSGALSATDSRIDGDAGTTAGVYDLVLQTTALNAATSIPIDLFLLTIGPNITN